MIKKALFITYFLASSFHGFAMDGMAVEMDEIGGGSRKNLPHVQRAPVKSMNCMEWWRTKRNSRIGAGGSSARKTCFTATAIAGGLTLSGAAITLWALLTQGAPPAATTALSSFNETTDLRAANFTKPYAMTTTENFSSEDFFDEEGPLKKGAICSNFYDEEGRLCRQYRPSYFRYFTRCYVQLRPARALMPLETFIVWLNVAMERDVKGKNLDIRHGAYEGRYASVFKENGTYWMKFSPKGRTAAYSILNKASMSISGSADDKDLYESLSIILLGNTNKDVQNFVGDKLQPNSTIVPDLSSCEKRRRETLSSRTPAPITVQQKSQTLSRRIREERNKSWGEAMYSVLFGS